MGRPLRIEYPDAFYHITARGETNGRLFTEAIKIRNVFWGILNQLLSVIKQLFIPIALWIIIIISYFKHPKEICLKSCIT